VILDGGRVVDVGTHDTLSQADGLYAELFRLRAGTSYDQIPDREGTSARQPRVSTGPISSVCMDAVLPATHEVQSAKDCCQSL